MNKKSLSAAAFLLLSAAGVLAADGSIVLPFAKSSVFKPCHLTLSPRHPKYSSAPNAVIDGRKVVQIAREAGTPRVGYFGMGQGKMYSPGTVLLTFDSKFVGDVKSASANLNYNKINMGNGSAGSEKITFQPGTGWETRTLEFTAAPETYAIQYVFSLNATPGAEWNIARLAVEYAPDKIDLQEKSPDLNLPPSKWAKFPQADCFFNYETGKATQARTAVKIAYDKTNFYVGYICYEPEMKLLKSKVTQRDGNVWTDDSVELFFFNPEKDVVKQFLTNSIGTQQDLELVQAQAGDPYKGRKWDGEWQTKTWKNANSWEAVMIIPWKTLGYDTIPANPAAVNFARERFANKEVSQWNCYIGNLNEVNNFARMDFVKKELFRCRKVEEISYIPKRAKTEFKKVLGSEKRNPINYMWSGEYFWVYLTPSVKARHSVKSVAPYQRMLLKEWAKAGTAAAGLPYACTKNNTILSIDEVAATGVKFPYVAKPHDRSAARDGAMPQMDITPGNIVVDPTDPMAIKSMLTAIENVAKVLKKDPRKAKMISFIHGIDEPVNPIRYLYSVSRNPGNKEFLEAFEKKLKAEYGFNKYGLYDDYGTPTATDAFERIAFWRWWNDRFAGYCKLYAAHCRKHLPGFPMQVFNRNTCAGVDPIDVALCGNDDFIISSDPYPTSTRSYYGIGRALYHTGFTTRLMRDLAPRASVNVIAQGFSYCGGTPKRADLREWASQALKNGTDNLHWYTYGTLSGSPEIYNEVLDITRQINDLPKLKLPKETKTGIFYSDYDRWGINDGAAHSAYMVYALLGEHIKSNFRFVSKVDFNVKGLKLLYIPRMRFTDPELTAKLVKFVKDGGTIVVLDPDFLRYNIDGTAVAARQELIGTELIKKANAGSELLYGKIKLPLSKVVHINQKENGSIHAFDFAKVPAGATVRASYSDNKPAIIERAYGKGKVIFSAVLPFGSSDLAIDPKGWKYFASARARYAGEKMGLAIWDFVLPEVVKDKFNVKYLQ